MSDPPAVTYRAFLSYSHRDKAQAVAWLQRLESLSIPDDLHGANTPLGPVPPHLRPIFRDELDFEPGRELKQATRDALDASAALILIASPNARASEYVNEEVRHFRATWPDRPIIPILCGPRGTAFRDHLPPALAYELDGHGQPTTAEHTPLASNPRSGTEATRIRVAARALGLTGRRLTVWVRDAVRAAREQRERDRVAKRRHQQTQRKLDGQDAKLDRLLALAEASDVFARAADQGISEATVRGIVERLGGQNITPEDLIPWLDNWIEHARAELDRHSNEGAAYDAAWRKAEALFNAGRMAEVADPFMEELRREEAREAERLAERRRHRVALLEAAIDFDTRALNIDAIPSTLRLIAAEDGITDPDALGRFLHDRADERYEHGRDKGDNTALLVAIATWRAALEEHTRNRVPLDWAMTQNNLGNALSTLGERESGTARLEQAVTAYRAALEEHTRDRVPLAWAMTQNNLGNALQALGARESGTARLEEAVAAYRATMEEYTRDRVPLDWAMTQNNLGTALSTLGERESGTAWLEEAVTAYRAALAERTRDRVPLAWASSQYNLSNALALLADRTRDRALLVDALGRMRGAAEVYREGGNSYWLPIAERRIAAIEDALAAWPAP